MQLTPHEIALRMQPSNFRATLDLLFGNPRLLGRSLDLEAIASRLDKPRVELSRVRVARLFSIELMDQFVANAFSPEAIDEYQKLEGKFAFLSYPDQVNEIETTAFGVARGLDEMAISCVLLDAYGTHTLLRPDANLRVAQSIRIFGNNPVLTMRRIFSGNQTGHTPAMTAVSLLYNLVRYHGPEVEPDAPERVSLWRLDPWRDSLRTGLGLRDDQTILSATGFGAVANLEQVAASARMKFDPIPGERALASV